MITILMSVVLLTYPFILAYAIVDPYFGQDVRWFIDSLDLMINLWILCSLLLGLLLFFTAGGEKRQ